MPTLAIATPNTTYILYTYIYIYICNASFNKILDDDLRSEAKMARKSFEQDETLAAGVANPVSPLNRELRASMLSPYLRERFVHLLV